MKRCARSVLVVTLLSLVASCSTSGSHPRADASRSSTTAAAAPSASSPSSPASVTLATLTSIPVKGRAPKTGYRRDRFGPAWADVDRNGCDTRNDVLARDLTATSFRPGTHDCVVVSGQLLDPYTGRTLHFTKSDASAVQIDHVVALSDAWQTGAFAWTDARRAQFANDPLNLLAVDGPTNERKGDADAATWLPPRAAFRCAYATRQVAVKARFGLWMTPAEHAAVARVLAGCARAGAGNARGAG